ncbi:MAG: hypothetical protein A2X61_06735 [Ignavibacteria bacterium GWB2_35_12]|nr:MAG: hypothetical protein A2X63_02640 [Ignavibacteria bacterium GWA2_35_8]OGU38635.1 MAG: hypothetical protein A2X61_06735 [Ignavibacteria bacterium GWB2_35_12]OGU93981.1 MAG: hypothetical protein A2220_04480 [Ignavibacteria bacterium RIFOXYA2_FULL_35_10]OGV22838.1 MAG: hypothetical protein A2475_02320 [Ignavibacteria bacterium RIFOXYC2_FULL_35_21]
MQTINSSMIAIRVTKEEKDKFNLLSTIDNKPLSQVVKELVNKELNSRKLSAKDLRKLPKEIRASLLIQMTEESMPYYNKHKKDLLVDEIDNGIE